jgi:hypothetical protein
MEHFRKTLASFSFVFVSVFLLSSCGKDEVVKDTQMSMSASKSKSVKIGEPVSFTLPSTNSTAVNWTVSPSSKAKIASSGNNNATVLFTSSGNYTVNAQMANSRLSSAVNVVDSVFTVDLRNATETPFVAGEQLNITVSRKDSVTGVSTISILEMLVKTTNNYNCQSSYIHADANNISGGMSYNFKSVYIPNGCKTGAGKAVGSLAIWGAMNNFTIVFNNKTYSGSIIQNGNKYTIRWPYTSGVVISPTSL